MMKNEELKDAILSCIFGHAVGDALGVPVEFSDREELDENPVTDMEGFGTFDVPAGCWSDDTSMTLCALDSLSKGKVDFEDVMNNFGKWYYEGEFTPTGVTFDVGRTCATAIENYFEKKRGIKGCGLTGEMDNGNGSLMRILPFAVCNVGDISLVYEASRLTHAHHRADVACGIYCIVLWQLFYNRSKKSVFDGIELAADVFEDDAEWQHYSRLVGIEKLSREEIKSSGYAVDTLEAALWCLLTTDSYEECVLKAVNLGKDTDTVAAVAGGLAGYLYGYDSIPKKWIDTLRKKEYIEELCNKVAEHEWWE